MGGEIARRRHFFGAATHAPKTIYFGGGTPSVLGNDQVGGLMGSLGQNFDLGSLVEFTFEANPEHLTDQYIEMLLSFGVNRLSIGVQSFFDDHLRQMNRKHDASRAVDAVRSAQDAGLTNISIDLIYGLPFMSDEQWVENVDRAIDLGVAHISAYHLSIEERTVFHKRGMEPIDESRSEWQYGVLCQKLAAAGFLHYEISNFAQPDKESLHNSGYWSGRPYLGIGPSAHSFDGLMTRSWNVMSNTLYLDGVEAKSELLTDRDIHNEYLMIRLRTARGVDPVLYEQLFGRRLAIGSSFVSEGGRVRIAESEWLVADALIAPLFL